jgi:ribosomal protein S18 acetylase RimI-like enzyme
LYFEPQSGEKLIRKSKDDGFKGTDLDEFLAARGVRTLVVCGVLSDMCVAATARSAMERGYNVILPHDAHATCDVPPGPGSEKVPAHMAARAAEWSLGDEVTLCASAHEVSFASLNDTICEGARSERAGAGIKLRPLNLSEDAPRLVHFDASYTTERTYDVVVSGLALSLVQTTRSEPFTKRFPMSDITEDIEEADAAWVAEDEEGGVAGFATARYQSWNRSVLITGIFVSPLTKQRVIGRRLLDAVETFARTTPARCVMVETQNTNVPAIRFYLRSAFQLCGMHTDLYDPNIVQPGEIALYFTRQLAFSNDPESPMK